MSLMTKVREYIASWNRGKPPEGHHSDRQSPSRNNRGTERETLYTDTAGSSGGHANEPDNR